MIEKPEGFELRDKRSDKTDDSHHWTGRDALYSAAQQMAGDTRAAIIVWQHPGGEIHFRKAGGAEWGALLATKFLTHGI